MTVKVAINGFGRIGRNYLRAIVERGEDVQIVALNDLAPLSTSAMLLRYDSILGPFTGSVEIDSDESLRVSGEIIRYFQEKDPRELPWGELEIDVVIESTGIFTTHEHARKHLQAGANKVIITAPANEPDITLVLGVNEGEYDADRHRIVSNASCTTNCLAPIAKILDDAYGIIEGSMVTIHAYTNDQNLMDSPHKDLRRARAAGVNMIPTSTGAAKAVGIVLPGLKGKLDGYAVRVPVPTGSMVSLDVRLNEDVTPEQVNGLIKELSKTPELSSIVEYTEDPIVSSDITKNPHSVIFDSSLTKKVGSILTVVLWYDNEWGYTNRLVDLTNKL